MSKATRKLLTILERETGFNTGWNKNGGIFITKTKVIENCPVTDVLIDGSSGVRKIKGRPELQMYTYDIRRVTPTLRSNTAWINETSHESSAKTYSILHPHSQPLARRNHRIGPFHKVFGVTAYYGNLMATSSENPTMYQPTNVIDGSLTDFKEIATECPNMLVDKTELIKVFCTEGEKHILITAPPRFGKSVNLSMFKCFFEIEVDPETGRLKTQLDPKTEAITDTQNYHLFADLNLAIMKYPHIVEKHLGRHPVLYVSFKCDMNMNTVYDAIELCRTVVHRAFKQHKYLCVSEKLTAANRAICEKWCYGYTYKKMDPSDALEHLAEFLYEHFRREVVFLVDEYDSLVATALAQAGKYNFEDVCEQEGVDHDDACSLLRRCDDWMKQIVQKHNITPGLVKALINASQQTRGEICSINGVDVNVMQQLVDEYEYMMRYSWSISKIRPDIVRILIEARENSIEEICQKPVTMIAALLKTQNPNIRLLKSLVTGISYIAGIGWSGIANNVTAYRFTQHHGFNRFYGFQTKEIEGLLDKLGKSPGFKVEKEKALNIIKSKYNGYEFPGSEGNAGKKIYCPWSVIKYLKEGSPQSFWAGASYTVPLKHMFKNLGVKIFLTELLEQTVTQQLHRIDKFSVNDLVELKKLMKGTSTNGSHELFLNFILELGYLTVDSTICASTTDYFVKIPNAEVKIMILGKLKDYYVEQCSQKFRNNALMKSRQILDCINSAADPNVSDEEFKEAIEEFRRELQTLFQQYSDSLANINESALHCFMAYIIVSAFYGYLTECHVPDDVDKKRGRLDMLGYEEEEFAFLVELKYYPTSRKSAIDALNQILKKRYFNAFNYLEMLDLKIQRHILMGISVNKDKKMAISAI